MILGNDSQSYPASVTEATLLRGLGPKGARVALAAGIARQFYETAEGVLFFEEREQGRFETLLCGMGYFCL